MSALLIIIVLVLAGVAIGQAVRIFEISNALKGKDENENEITDDDNNRQGWYMLIFMFGMFITFIWMSA